MDLGASVMISRSSTLGAIFVVAALAGPAKAEVRSINRLPDTRLEFMRSCAPHMFGRWSHPEAVCGCLHDHAAAFVEDSDLRDALLRGISENGVPIIENDWVPAAKRSQISATFTKIARPALQCMFEPLD